MQYILTEDEYNHLKANKRKFTAAEKAELQELCTLAARPAPVNRPCGCILDGVTGYHDLCPHPDKNFSK